MIIGGTGDCNSSFNPFMLVSIKYPIKTFPTVIVTLPRKPIKAPIPFVMMKDPLFLRANTNAAIAEEQKFLPVSAT